MKIPSIVGGKPTRKKILIFGAPHIGKEEVREVAETLQSGWLGTGPKTSRFETEFANFVGVKYARAVSSCTAGLHLSLIAAGVSQGDEVITSPLTFASTANVILHVGANPVFVDVNLPQGTIDCEKIEKKITKKTKVILPIHLYGLPAEMDTILKMAKKRNLKVISDAAHAIGTIYRGKKIGSIGDLTAFSFYVTKNIMTGEGGMVTTNNKSYANIIELYAMHGMSRGAWKRYSDQSYKHYLIKVPGYKFNMTDIQASLGIHQLKRFPKNQKRRKIIWQRYNKAFANLPVILPADPIDKNSIHAMHLYTLLLNLEKLKVSRDFIQQGLYHENIGTGVHFVSLHRHPYYEKRFGFKKTDFPNATFISERTLSLPMASNLSDQDVEDVINAVKKVINYYTK